MAERKRSYKPGYRNKPDFENKPGLMSKNRWAWVSVYFGQFVIWADLRKDAEGNLTDEVLDIKLVYPIPNRPPVTWNLTALTEEELVSIKHLFDTAFEWAMPIVQQRDKEAQDALEAGDDSHSRIYRQVPKLVYRSGPESQHGESLQHGSEDAAGVPRDGDDPLGGLRGDGPDVAERDEGSSSTQDNRPTVNQPPRIREMGEHRDGAE